MLISVSIKMEENDVFARLLANRIWDHFAVTICRRQLSACHACLVVTHMLLKLLRSLFRDQGSGQKMCV